MQSELIQGDCLEEMPKLITRGIKFDAIIADIPYGTTNCKWDVVIPFEKMWPLLNQLKRNEHTPIVLFGCEPFTSFLICSNVKQFKYDWIWDKKKLAGFLNAKKMPLRKHEHICIFYDKLPTYNPQKTYTGKKTGIGTRTSNSECYRELNKNLKYIDDGSRYPTSIIDNINGVINNSKEKVAHPTQKPVALMEYLVKTYTNEGDTVLDFTMGSNPTGKACKKLNRNYVGIEKDEDFFKIAQETT